MVISKLRAEIAYIPVYICAICGQSANGAGVRIEYNGSGPHESYKCVGASDMPLGWLFNGEFYCELCK